MSINEINVPLFESCLDPDLGLDNEENFYALCYFEKPIWVFLTHTL